jgi:ABC-type Na+ efflux pump permease subunit
MGPKRTLTYCLLGLLSTALIVLARAGTARADISVSPAPILVFGAIVVVGVFAIVGSAVGVFFLVRQRRRKREGPR